MSRFDRMIAMLKEEYNLLGIIKQANNRLQQNLAHLPNELNFNKQNNHKTFKFHLLGFIGKVIH